MNFNYINNTFAIFLLTFIFSCQNNFIYDHKEDDQKTYIKKIQNEKNEILDLSFNKIKEENIIDFYTNEALNIDFFNKDIKKVKVKNNIGNELSNNPVNLIYDQNVIYSVNLKGELLKYNIDTGKLKEKLLIDFDFKYNKVPVSFSLIENDFIIGFKSGEILKLNKNAQVLWSFEKKDLLNTPIKVYNDYIIILYSDEIVILSSKNGKMLFNKKYILNKIIQSSGGKIINYYNIIYFILPNSHFHSVDTYLFDEHLSNLNNIELTTSLNNLDDNIHIYKDLFVYIDNINIINTFDLVDNKFLLKNYRINNNSSYYLFNNSLIIKNENYLDFYNIKNGKLFFNININKKLKKDSKIIKVISINNKLHLFTNYGKLLILDDNKQIEEIIDLKIKKINKIYNYKNKIFISTEKGITYIF